MSFSTAAAAVSVVPSVGVVEKTEELASEEEGCSWMEAMEEMDSLRERSDLLRRVEGDGADDKAEVEGRFDVVTAGRLPSSTRRRRIVSQPANDVRRTERKQKTTARRRKGTRTHVSWPLISL